MFKDSNASLIWNRACTGDLTLGKRGDWALALMLELHGGAMNAGLLHAVGGLDAEELAAAEASYRYFGLDDTADLIAEAAAISKRGDDSGDRERELIKRYAALIPSDATLAERVERALRCNPSEFAPI